MKFRRPYEPCASLPSNSGETKKPVFTLVNRNGERSLKQVDEIDIPEHINSFADMTDLKAMLKRYSLTGDMSILNGRGNYVYADVSSCETDYAKLIQSSREIALLELQIAQAKQGVSSDEAAAGADAGAATGADAGAATGADAGAATGADAGAAAGAAAGA